MQIPETPQSVTELELMKRLDEYAGGTASWLPDEGDVGEGARQACRTLHTNLINLINGMFAYVLDRVTAREMETFTMHDRVHGPAWLDYAPVCGRELKGAHSTVTDLARLRG
jgi:hypothetical protein